MASTSPFKNASQRGDTVSVAAEGPRTLARRMTTHAALALLVFAVMQCIGVVLFNSRPWGQWLPFVSLAVLVLGAIPYARLMDRRWKRLADQALPSDHLARRYRGDRARLWKLAALMPAAWLFLYAIVAEAAVRL
ncbi:MAG: hypothetical protein MUF41_00010 [Sphingopyxis sp.]|jgi:hypothetical protein|nr:hypothetical protein [Sphingopyxis sp.]